MEALDRLAQVTGDNAQPRLSVDKSASWKMPNGKLTLEDSFISTEHLLMGFLPLKMAPQQKYSRIAVSP